MSARIVVFSCVLLALSQVAQGVSLFQVDTFQSGTTDGWGGGANPTNIPNGGPQGAGDAFLQIISNGIGGPGSKPATYNGDVGSPWVGDYSGLGVRAITLEMMNSVSSDPLEMRLAMFGSGGASRWTSVTAEPVPNDGQWRRYRFFISETELTQVLGTITYADLIGNVSQILLRHDPDSPSAGGEVAVATLGFDNIRLVPNIDCTVFDNLVAAIASGGNDPNWDINRDTVVDISDLDELRALGGLINLPSRNAYLPGDANLDGSVDGSDFIAWNAHKFTANASWCSGDFNADGSVDGSDFIIWNAHKFTSADVTFVPEPAHGGSWLFVLFAMLGISAMRLKLSHQSRVPHPVRATIGR